MNFQDTWETNEDGKQFIFTVEMKRRLANADLPIEPASLKELKEVPRPMPVPEARSRPAARTEQPTFEEPDVIQIDPGTGKYIGRLKWYNPSRGYGFISRGGGEDIFFHRTSSLTDPAEMAEGQMVLYDVEDRAKGPEATEVEPHEEPSA